MAYHYSAVAAVLDADGGWRTVVDDLENMPGHVGPGEELLVLPGFYVFEPVEDVAGLIERVAEHVRRHRPDRE
jgi:hypothetical protein